MRTVHWSEVLGANAPRMCHCKSQYPSEPPPNNHSLIHKYPFLACVPTVHMYSYAYL